MKNPRLSIVALLAAGLLFAFSGSNPISLIRIAKNQPLLWTVLQRCRIDVRQELDSCYLALADREGVDILQKHGIRLDVLDGDSGKKDYLIVPLPAPNSLSALQAKGKAVPVELWTAVFWTDAGRSLEAIPAGLPNKPLPSHSILSYLRPPRSLIRRGLTIFHDPDPFIKTLVAKVSESGLSSVVQSLQNFQTRFASTPNCEAAGQFIFNVFSALGLDDVRFEPFTFYGSYSSRNVVAEKTGESFPEDVLIICAHYDSTSSASTRETRAPGADDNASGTASVLEAARILAPVPLDFTVRFIAFSAEEWGLWGSRAYAAQARTADERIIGVINLDMIAYADSVPEDLRVIVDERSEWMADRLTVTAAEYGGIVVLKTINPSIVYSDHASFWDQGYPALLGIEDSLNPYYHKTTDTLDKLNLDFFSNVSRASLGLLAELAQPLKTGYPKTPVELNASTTLYSSLFNVTKSVRLTWSGQADAVGYNVYRTSVSHLDYMKINGAPVNVTTFTDRAPQTGVPYYYVITAVGGAGIESNYSREVEVAAEFSTERAGISGLNLFWTAGGQ